MIGTTILSQVTHVSLAGGVFVIPDELIQEFYRRYAINLNYGSVEALVDTTDVENAKRLRYASNIFGTN